MLEVTEAGANEEIRLEVVRMAERGAPIFKSLEVIRFSWRPRQNIAVSAPTPTNIPNSVNAVTRETVVLDANKESGLIPYKTQALPFKSPIMHEQVKMTPAWVTNPSYFDPCETEGVWHNAHECGLPYSYFLD
jgi:hypothetical protein